MTFDQLLDQAEVGPPELERLLCEPVRGRESSGEPALVSALEDWVKTGADHERLGELDRHIRRLESARTRAIARAIRRAAELAGQDPAPAGDDLDAELAGIHRELTEAAPDVHHISVGTLRQLTASLQDALHWPSSPPEPRRWTTRFPLIWKEGGTLRGHLARIVVTAHPRGTGDAAFHRCHLFTDIRRDFAAALASARDAAASLLGDIQRTDASVRIETIDPPDRPHRGPLDGRSGGGALALALWSAWLQRELDDELVTTGALGESGDGWRTVGVRELVEKAAAIVRDAVERREFADPLFLIPGEQASERQAIERQARDRGLTLTVASPASLTEATAAATPALTAYLGLVRTTPAPSAAHTPRTGRGSSTTSTSRSSSRRIAAASKSTCRTPGASAATPSPSSLLSTRTSPSTRG